MAGCGTILNPAYTNVHEWKRTNIYFFNHKLLAVKNICIATALYMRYIIINECIYLIINETGWLLKSLTVLK